MDANELSAILDLYDRRIVSYIISDHNDNPIVFNTFKAAVKANPDAQTPMLGKRTKICRKKLDKMPIEIVTRWNIIETT